MNVMLRWLKSLASSIREWWGIMSGALSIPFAFLALFNVPGRLLFASLAYIGLWALVFAQARRISELQKPVSSPKVVLRVGTDLIYPGNQHDWIRGEITNEGDGQRQLVV